jgi:hypothetical protein
VISITCLITRNPPRSGRHNPSDHRPGRAKGAAAAHAQMNSYALVASLAGPSSWARFAERLARSDAGAEVHQRERTNSSLDCWFPWFIDSSCVSHLSATVDVRCGSLPSPARIASARVLRQSGVRCPDNTRARCVCACMTSVLQTS